ncbi:DotG/IcmE/VirB10 family protein [Acinetobacter baumannii]|uniref:DotG/IcmE/VirB10 family protein n=1 Tax=Acinetobacter baumannii TaxID=470 RepID=UPI002AB99642|nr:DotG/IcmE/VirB10 family protein [Acinetobacter baumannii]MDZ4011089.1 DotG/IcmE/VirB10 family protein [Acinetobacter baumannii]MDZ4025239.1 DotG/IcmE/VirB10 family protein [Acinetobacter baumannii]
MSAENNTNKPDDIQSSQEQFTGQNEATHSTHNSDPERRDPLTPEYETFEENQTATWIPRNDADNRINMKFGDKFKLYWRENGVFRFIIITVGAVILLILFFLMKFIFRQDAPEQINPANIKMDAPQSNTKQAEYVSQEQYTAIRKQEEILARQAAAKGESYIPRNLVIAPTDAQGQVVLPSTSNAQYGAMNPQQAGLMNSTGQLTYANPAVAGQQGQMQQQGMQQGQPQPQYIPVQTQDYVSDVAANYEQNNNQFANWFDEESQRQITANKEQEQTINSFVLKQIGQITGAEFDANGNMIPKSKDKKTKAGSYAQKTYYTAPASADNSGNGSNTGNSANNAQDASPFSANGNNPVNGKKSGTGKVLIPAGTRSIARLLGEVNTDDGNQVFAQVTNGPLKGRKVFGTVSKSNDNIQFKIDRVLSDGKNKEFSIDAVGQTLQGSYGMATYIKRHTLQRYGALIASGIAQGYGQAYSQAYGQQTYTSGATVIETKDPSGERIAGNIIGQVGQNASQEIQQIGRKQVTYITPVGTVFYIFFNQDVTE